VEKLAEGIVTIAVARMTSAIRESRSSAATIRVTSR